MKLFLKNSGTGNQEPVSISCAKHFIISAGHYYQKHSIKDNKVFFTEKYKYTLDELKEKFGEKEFIINSCKSCKKKIKFEKEDISEFICPKCEKKRKRSKEFRKMQQMRHTHGEDRK